MIYFYSVSMGEEGRNILGFIKNTLICVSNINKIGELCLKVLDFWISVSNQTLLWSFKVVLAILILQFYT